MRKIIIALVMGVSLLFLLSSSTSEEPAQAISVKPTVKTLSTTSVEDSYLWGLHSFHESRIEAVPDADLIIAGQNACSLLDESYPISNVVIYLVSSEESVNGDTILANEIVASAVSTMCKEFMPQLNAVNP